MTIDEMPEDLHSIAYDIADGNHGEAETMRLIVEALLAERERSAVAAEVRGRELREYAIGSDIANTIRMGRPSPPE